MSMLYAVEGWIMSIAGWGWITVRDMVPDRPLIEDVCIYSTLLVSTINFGLCSFLQDRSEVSKAYLGFTLMLWTFLAYALIDGLKIYDTGSYLVPQDLNLCCPNRNVPAMNRAFYFGGMSAYLASGAVTFAFQTVQVLVSGAALVSAQGSVWPGNGWGYGVAAMLSTAYFIRFSGVVAPPCPGGAFRSLFGIHTSMGLVFGFFTVALSALIVLDGIEVSSKMAMLSMRGGGLIVVTLFCASICYASHGLGMLTFAVIFILAKAWLPVGWSIIEPFMINHVVHPTSATVEPVRFRQTRKAMRWVMPIQAKLEKAFPCPIRTEPAESEKKMR